MPTPTEVEIRRVREQVHSGNYFIYPKLSAGVILSSGVGVYDLGSYAELVPSNTITTSFWIVGAIILDASSGVEYIIDIATGGVGSEVVIGTLCFKYGVAGNDTGVGVWVQAAFAQSNLVQGLATQSITIIPSQDPVFPVAFKVAKNTRVSARLATSVGGYTCKAKVKYKI